MSKNKTTVSTREALIAAASKLFFQRGLDKTTFSDVAKVAGISQPGVYKHFRDKRDLLLNCCLENAARGREFIDRRIDEHKRAEDQLYGYVEGNLRWVVEKKEEAFCLISLYYFSHSDDELLKVHQQIEHVGSSRISVLLAHGSHEGRWKIADRARTTRLIRNLLVGEMLHHFYNTSTTERIETKAVFEAILRIIMSSSRGR